MDEDKDKNGIKKYVDMFEASERVMRSDFLPKYALAKARLKAEHEIKNKGTRKLTHEQVNLVHSIGVNFVNSVYFKSPQCNLTARQEIDYKQVENTEVAVNDWLKDKKVKQIVKKTIWDAYLGGIGAVFVDYEYDDVEDESRPIMRSEIIPSEEGLPIEGQVQETDEEGKPLFERLVLKNEITIQRIRPDLLRFPENFDVYNYKESPWIGFEVIHPIEEIKNNQYLDANQVEKIEGEAYDKLSKFKDNRKSNDSKSPDKYAKLSYCFKKPDNPLEPYKLTIFHKDCEAPLLEIDYKKGHKDYPIHFLAFNPNDDDCPYPNGDPWNFESQLNAIDKWWQKMNNHVNRSNPKIVYDSSSVEPQEAQKLKSNNDNELVGLKNKHKRSLRDLVDVLEKPAMHSDLHRVYEVAREVISEVSPKTALSRGAEDNKADTATEAKIMQAGEMIDTDARIDDVAEFIKAIVLDVAGIYEESYIGSMSLRKESEEGEEYFEESGEAGFTSAINVDVDIESMQSQNKDVLRKHLIETLQLVGQLNPLINAAGKKIEPLWWFEKLLDTMSVRNIEKGFTDIMQVAQVLGMDQAPDAGVPSNEIPSGDQPPEAVENSLGQSI